METNMTSADKAEHRSDEPYAHLEAHSSGVAWAAVIGGAFMSAAFWLILLALGAGFGLSMVSPWSHVSVSASALGTAAIVWLILVEIIAFAWGATSQADYAPNGR
jgi:CBS domain containing-hemolysin-like protein